MNKSMSASLEELLGRGLDGYFDVCQEINEKASRELALENAKFNMEREWDEVKFTLLPYKDTGTYILTDLEPIWDLLDDHIIKTASIITSPFVAFIEKEIGIWQAGLVKV
jgi:dynein heavy chain